MATGPTSTYGLTTGIQLDVEDLIQFTTPSDIPLQGQTSGVTDAVGLPTGPVFEKKYEWLDETLLTPRSTIAATSTTTEGSIYLAAGDQLRFQTGDVLLIGSEYMRVLGYSVTTADALLVTRAFSGSGATVATNADVIGVGSALPEGSAPPAARFLDRNNRFNYTQIFGPYKIESTNSDLAIRKYGITNEFDHQVANRIKEAGVAIDQALAYGVRLEQTAANQQWRTLAGIFSHITSNIDAVASGLTMDKVNVLMQTIFTAGGAPDVFMVGPTQKRVISTFSTNGVVQIMRPDQTAGRTINVIETDFGTLAVKLNRWFRSTDAAIFTRDQTEIVTLRPLQYQPLAITGDSMPGMLVAEKGFKFYRQVHAAKFTALT